MALGATIFKAALQIADLDRNYYADHALTLARHPSETDERLMVRLLAFALNASEDLVFGRGISAEDEADLWRMDLTGQVDLWIEVGAPDEKALRKACSRAREVRVYSYGGRVAEAWWKQIQGAARRMDKLRAFSLSAEATRDLAALAQRNMRLQITLQEGQALITDGKSSVALEPLALHA
jgi:uncharacterized protein YaeQ